MLRKMAAAFSMYSKIPMPYFELDDKDCDDIIMFLPLIGVVCAIAVYGVHAVAAAFGLPAAAEAAARIVRKCFFNAVMLLYEFKECYNNQSCSLRLSMTRTALPSLRVMDFGATRCTFGLMPSIVLIAPARLRSFSLACSSVNRSS